MSTTDESVGDAREEPRGWRAPLDDVIRYTPSGDTIPDGSWRRRHRNILIVLVAHVPLLLLLGLYEGTDTVITGATIPSIPRSNVALELTVILSLAGLASLSRFSRRFRTVLATVGLVVSSAVMVHFSGGFIEAQFHFFVVMGVVAVYEDWLPFLVGIVFVAIQHGYFGMIDPSRVYNHQAAISNPWVWGVIHAVFVLGLATALMSNWYSTERSREQTRQREAEVDRKAAEIDELEEKRQEIQRLRAKAERKQEQAQTRQQAAERLSTHLESVAQQYSATLAQAAEGNLTVRLDPDEESDPMAEVATSVNEMLSDLESTVGEIQTFATTVETTRSST